MTRFRLFFLLMLSAALSASVLLGGCAATPIDKDPPQPAERQAGDMQQQQYDELQAQTEATEDAPKATVEVVDGGRSILLTLTAMFATGQSTLRPNARSRLEPLFANMRDYPGNEAAIIGHADSEGGTATNQRLSEARAGTVADYLQSQGIAPERIVTVEGRGEEQPVAGNATAEGRALNRRVEVNILPPPEPDVR